MRITLEWIDRRRVLKQIRLPLARVTTNETIKIIEAHSNRPLIEWPSLARLIRRRVVVLTEPRRRIPVLFQDCTNGAFLNRNDGIITRKAGRYFADYPISNRMMVPAR